MKMKSAFLFILISIFSCSCGKVNVTKTLDSYLQSFGVDLKYYKVVCFVPADGCGNCIDPSLDYSKKTSKDFLLVLASTFKKSIDFIKESKQIEELKIVSDSQNLAASLQLVSVISPCYILKKMDVSIIQLI